MGSWADPVVHFPGVELGHGWSTSTTAGMSLTINSLDLVAKAPPIIGFQHLPSAAERSAKDLDEVVALAGQRKYRALVDKTFPRRAGHRDHRSPRMSAKAPRQGRTDLLTTSHIPTEPRRFWAGLAATALAAGWVSSPSRCNPGFV
jgi:hypothetical protein